VLAVFGGLDINKNVEYNARVMREIVEPRGNGSEVVVFPEANHGIFETKRRIIYARELPVVTRLAPGYLEQLTAWIRSRSLGSGLRP
jgi:hypothetical protein